MLDLGRLLIHPTFPHDKNRDIESPPPSARQLKRRLPDSPHLSPEGRMQFKNDLSIIQTVELLLQCIQLGPARGTF